MILFQAGSRSIDIELTTLSSANHVELNPSDAGFQDRYIVQEIIKEMAKNRPIDTKGKKGFKGNSKCFYFYFLCFSCSLMYNMPIDTYGLWDILGLFVKELHFSIMGLLMM